MAQRRRRDPSFLAASDREAIQERLATDYLPAVALTVAVEGGRIVGFAGTAESKLEMLFVHASSRGRGVGSALLERVIERDAVVAVDVNEQNPEAVGFYLAKGFEITGRSDVDDDGRPYPLLRMRLPGSGAGLLEDDRAGL